MSSASDSTASQDAYAANLEIYAHLHPRTLRDEEMERTEPLQLRSTAWDGFDDAQARAWCRVTFLLPRGGHSATVMACAASAWKGGGVPHFRRNAETARFARALGHTPETAWELMVALHTLSKTGQITDALWYEPLVWSLWLGHRQAGADPLEAARSSVGAVQRR